MLSLILQLFLLSLSLSLSLTHTHTHTLGNLICVCHQQPPPVTTIAAIPRLLQIRTPNQPKNKKTGCSDLIKSRKNLPFFEFTSNKFSRIFFGSNWSSKVWNVSICINRIFDCFPEQMHMLTHAHTHTHSHSHTHTRTYTHACTQTHAQAVREVQREKHEEIALDKLLFSAVNRISGGH